MRLLLAFLRRYALRYWPWYGTGIFFLLATNWLTVKIPLSLAVAIDALGPTGDPQVVRRCVWAIAAMGVGIMVARTLSRVLFFTPGRLVEYELKGEIFGHLLKLQPAFYARWETGDIISRASNDITFLRALVGFGGLQVFNVTAGLAMAGGAMLTLSPRLTILTLLPILVAILVVRVGIQRLYVLTRRGQQELSTLSAHVLSSLQGFATIQGFNAQPAVAGRFVEHNEAYLKTRLGVAWVAASTLPLLVLASSVSLWVLLVVGAPMVKAGTLSVGELVAFTTYVGILLVPLRSLSWMLSVFQRGYTSLERINELLDAVPERPEGEEGLQLEAGRGPRIEIRDLSFAYPDSPDVQVLRDVNATLESGEVVGLFGRTGSGKTTLLRVLSRLYNPPEGSVFADGVDLRHLDLAAWRKQMAVVPQQPFLFSQTIAENVSMGEPDEAHLRLTLSRAALNPDLQALPKGLDTLVGQRGIMLSGGQRQRVALARGIYREFDLLILDDVLSAVDHATEQALVQTIEEMSHTRGARGKPTCLLVSHRISAMVNTDRILVMDEGALVDEGPHEDLVERPGPYRDAWLLQKGSEKVAR